MLTELRGTQNLLYDLFDRPDWVRQKLEEINQAFFTAFDDYYEHIRISMVLLPMHTFAFGGLGRFLRCSVILLQ